MNRRKLILFTVLGTIALVVPAALLSLPTTAQPPASNKAATTKPVAQPVAAGNGAAVKPAQLPIGQVILFSSGVGYFQREGEIEGNTRVDLAFRVTDVNDLLKSLVLQDLGNGKISTISYDSHDPIDKTLRSFALDLTANPSFGQILNQARGEKIEITLQSNTAQPGNLTGVIIGMESQRQPAGKDSFVDVELLNLLTSDGLRSLPLTQVQRVRFLNQSLEGELRRALEVLAAAHDAQKKSVSLSFTGNGKRPVRVGYVVENPIWKTSYRLVLDQKGKPHLQGWAVVENTSDDDWNNVRMVLVSGRPISYQMNLYQPLYIPRPTVEPELFASLRPPIYSGALTGPGAPPAAMGMMGGGFAGYPGAQPLGGFYPYASGNRYQQQPQMNIGQLGQFGQLGIGFPVQSPALPQASGDASSPNMFSQGYAYDNRLSYEELQRRQHAKGADSDKAKKVGSAIAMDPKASISSIACAEEIGDYFQYSLDQKVSLARQKSAMLPIVNKDVEGARVSIFNESVHAKFPLLGLKFKNTSGQPLMQGPITVYEGGSYSGDARIPDLQPGEERLISYAIDLGTEVKTEGKTAPDQLVSVKIVKGVLQANNKLRQTRSYLIKNRSPHARELIIEHPMRTGWKLVKPEKIAEHSREYYRIQLPVASGKAVTEEVVEEHTRQDHTALTRMDDRTVLFYTNHAASSPKVKEALGKAISLRGKLAETQREQAELVLKLKRITDDQTRLRANLKEVPPTSAAYKRYLEKFDQQEPEIEKLQAQIQKAQETDKKQRAEYEDYVAKLSVE